jgi:hypothetical protein
MRNWKERELVLWLEARLEEVPLRTDQRLSIARSLARQLLESPAITLRFDTAAWMQRQGKLRTAGTKRKRPTSGSKSRPRDISS